MSVYVMRLGMEEDEDGLRLLFEMMLEGVELELFHCAASVGELKNDERVNEDQAEEMDETIVDENVMV